MPINTYNYSNQNNAFDNLMSGGVSSAPISAQNLPEAEANGFGTLIAQVTTAGGAIPIKGATITISSQDDTVISTQVTDQSGRINPIRLPAPSASASQSPNEFRPYSLYNMRVEYPDYYTEEFKNIAVFDKIRSVQPVSLEPLGEDATVNDKIITIDEEINQ